MMKQTPLAVFDEKQSLSTEECDECLFTTRKDFTGFKNQSLARDIASRIRSKDIFFSLEFLPPRNHFGEIRLLERLESIQDGGPLFCSVTWHSAGTVPDSKTPSVRLAASMATSFNFHTMLHLAANELTKDQVMSILRQAQLNGVRTILALRGDRTPGWQCPENGFQHAVDLVHFIREKFGDIFTIGVAGYPSGHYEAPSYYHDLRFLKEKVDAGADFVISQIFYSAKIFMKFYKDCKTIGINVPVIPGILPILSYSSFIRIANLCRLEIPEEITNCLLRIKDNEKSIINFGIYFAVNLAKDILQTGNVPAAHFYTLNREKPIVSICKQLGLWAEELPRYVMCPKDTNKADLEESSILYLTKNGCRILLKYSISSDSNEYSNIYLYKGENKNER
ncbi:methylenetetrahydrofolate reductase [Ischnura elegans]|uniref:methylenetetrahydrofolate reductase n=1 Tax=Ischnura elegans TaxID=197161 RepID=UPI001ED8971B|nr:methylenetetrahydrofolate reductase [Ischnura elegans]